MSITEPSTLPEGESTEAVEVPAPKEQVSILNPSLEVPSKPRKTPKVSDEVRRLVLEEEADEIAAAKAAFRAKMEAGKAAAAARRAAGEDVPSPSGKKGTKASRKAAKAARRSSKRTQPTREQAEQALRAWADRVTPTKSVYVHKVVEAMIAGQPMPKPPKGAAWSKDVFVKAERYGKGL